MSNGDEEQVIRNTLQELRHLDLKSDVPVVGKELREIILKQMELTHALFNRQHRDVLKQMELNRSFFERQHQDVNEMHSSVKRFTASSKSRKADNGIDWPDWSTCSNDISSNTALDKDQEFVSFR